MGSDGFPGEYGEKQLHILAGFVDYPIATIEQRTSPASGGEVPQTHEPNQGKSVRFSVQPTGTGPMAFTLCGNVSDRDVTHVLSWFYVSVSSRRRFIWAVPGFLGTPDAVWRTIFWLRQ